MKNSIMISKTFLLFCFTMLFVAINFTFGQSTEAQIPNEPVQYAEDYKFEDYKNDYSDKFNTQEDKRDFLKLRMYLNKKKAFKASLEEILKKYKISQEVLNEINQDLKNLERRIQGQNDTTELANISINAGGIYYSSTLDKITVETVKNEIIPDLNMDMDYIMQKDTIAKQLVKNIALVDIDISDCIDQIDESISPEYKKQDFRKSVSLNFTLLILVLLLGFFFIIYQKSDDSLGELFLTGSGLQFITLFILIISVILFGILGILEGRELAAILSGISGYILGKGVNLPKKDNPQG